MNKLNKIICTIISLIVINGITTLIFSQSKKESNNKNSKSQNADTSILSKLKRQPGAILSIIVQNDSTWIFKVNLLTRNPKWLPGVDSTGDFFLSLNKIVNLTISNKSKTYKCDDRGQAKTFSKTSDFINEIQKTIKSYKNEAERLGREPNLYSAYFDIDGSTITAIYEQCLP
jgi:hypothetical protein